MEAPARPTTGALIAALVVTALILLVWLVALSWLTSLNDSDAAGNGMTQGFAALALIFLWVLLGVLALIAALGGDLPLPAALAALVLIPASGYAALVALSLLGNPRGPPYEWPLAEPAAVPPLVVALCLWAVMPPLRRAVPAWLAGGAAWGAVAALCLVLWPMSLQRDADEQRAADAAAKAHAAFVAMPADAPLWQWTPFLVMNGPDLDAALDRVRHLAHRQADAETMLTRGDFPLRYLGQIDLAPTPAVCAAARAQLRTRVAPLVLATPQSKPYLDIWIEVDAALSAMAWLAKSGCPIKAEAAQWEAMASAYRNPNFDVVQLRELRDGTY